MTPEESINYLIGDYKSRNEIDTNQIRDGYHSFGELYEHRIRLFISLCRAICQSMEMSNHHRNARNLQTENTPNYVWAYVENQSEEWFLLGICKGKGEQITYHIPARFWSEVCEFAEILSEKPEWDGHTSNDVLERLKTL